MTTQRVQFRGVPYSVDPRCLAGLEVGQLAGTGRYGEVYFGCEPDQETCDRIIKIVRLDSSPTTVSTLAFDHEVLANGLASDLEVAPALIDAFICPTDDPSISLGFLISDAWDFSLLDWLAGLVQGEYAATGVDLRKTRIRDLLPTNALRMIESKINRLHQAGIAHGDLHEGNVLLRIDDLGRITDVAIIDYGSAIVSGRAVQQDRLVVLSEEEVEKEFREDYRFLNFGPSVPLQPENP